MKHVEPLPKHIEDWAKKIFKIYGWNFDETLGFDETDSEDQVDGPQLDASRRLLEKVQKELQESLANDEPVDESFVSSVICKTIAEDALADHDEVIAQIGQDIEELEEFGLIGTLAADQKTNLTNQAKKLKLQLQEYSKLESCVKDHDAEYDAFIKSKNLAKQNIEKVVAALKSGMPGPAEVAIADGSSALTNMFLIWRGIASEDTRATVPDPSELPEATSAEIKAHAATVKQAMANANSANFPGLAIRLGTNLKQNIDWTWEPQHPCWNVLLWEAQDVNNMTSDLKRMSADIETYCDSIADLGKDSAVQRLMEDLEDYRSSPKRAPFHVKGLMQKLRNAAKLKDLNFKRQWLPEDLQDQTEKFRGAMRKFVEFDEDGEIITKKDKDRAYVRQGDIPELDHDVMMRIPKRPDETKAVPRETVHQLLDTLDVLDQIKATGIKDIEDVAYEEFDKAEEILDGLKNNPAGYEELKRLFDKLYSKLEKCSSSKNEELLYIEDKLRLKDRIDTLKSKYPSMNVDKAIAQAKEIQADISALKINVRAGVSLIHLFESSASSTKKNFARIPPLLAEIGRANEKIAHILAPLKTDKDERRYHGELEVELARATELLEASNTKEDVREALNKVEELHEKSSQYVNDLRVRKKELSSGQQRPLSAEEEAFFNNITTDYQEGIQRMKNNAESKQSFNDVANPIIEEINMLTAPSMSLSAAKGKLKGIARLDPAKFDSSRLQELKSEILLLKQDSKKHQSHNENMGRLKELEETMNALRGEVEGFRNDIADTMVEQTRKVVDRIQKALDQLNGPFADAVKNEQADDQDVVATAELNKFLKAVAAPFAIGKLQDYAKIISNRDEDLKNRKKARESALRIVRPMIAALESNAAVKHFQRHPFSKLENHFNVLKPLLAHLEIQLLTLAK